MSDGLGGVSHTEPSGGKSGSSRAQRGGWCFLPLICRQPSKMYYNVCVSGSIIIMIFR